MNGSCIFSVQEHHLEIYFVIDSIDCANKIFNFDLMVRFHLISIVSLDSILDFCLWFSLISSYFWINKVLNKAHTSGAPLSTERLLVSFEFSTKSSSTIYILLVAPIFHLIQIKSSGAVKMSQMKYSVEILLKIPLWLWV